MRIKAHAQESGCRAIADIFNKRFAAERGISVGKTYVAGILREHMAEIMNLRKTWKHRIPGTMSRNIIWGMDLTGITDSNKAGRNIFGIVDHGSRKCLSLKALDEKASITLLKSLLDVIERHGKPKAIRTDDEAVFTCRRQSGI